MNNLATWSTPQWRTEATAWADERLAAHGLERTGDVEQPHLRSWATVLRIPTSGGAVWLKAPGGGTAFEIPLYPLLLAAAPDQVLHPLAIDPDRRWLLLPDGGPPLGELAKGPALIDALVDALPGYARLQRRLASRADDLLGIGLPDLRPTSIPDRYADCLAEVADYVARRADPEEVVTLQRLRALEVTVRQWADELAASPVRPSLDHNDLHPWNLLCAAGDVAQARTYDWGDAVVGHPFASLMVVLGWLTNSDGEGLVPDSAAVLRVRDAYLAEFADLAPHAALVRDVELAARSAKLGRALSWIGVLHASGEHLTGELAQAPLYWLSRLLSDS
ncbi:MAG TPA: phosphotransferase [Sporichthya sp.]|nr:phosphotransferase [Sporichthya sp.]